jgi:hypothetical protein
LQLNPPRAGTSDFILFIITSGDVSSSIIIGSAFKLLRWL